VPERHVAVAGTRLFLDLRGAATDPPLLYVHGGPAMSCYEFMAWQGDRLARSLHVIGMDQRGVLRSDPLGDGETFTEDTLVDDCEAVREALGIPRWTVLSHSFGGRIALRYAVRHPERVAAAIFECPGWDFDETEQLRLPAAAAIFDELGEHENARLCREFAASPPDSIWATLELLVRLVPHDRYDDLYFHQPAAREAWRASQRSSLPDELRARSQRHQNVAIPLMRESVVPLLAQLTVPATLIVAGHDLVTGPRQVAAFERLVPHGTVVRFPNSSHFPQLEEAEAYAELVIDTVRGLA
jgi:proline iminopeptidase